MSNVLVRHRSISELEFYNSYMSWRGYIGHKDAHRTILSMDKLFRELFTSKEE